MRTTLALVILAAALASGCFNPAGPSIIEKQMCDYGKTDCQPKAVPR